MVTCLKCGTVRRFVNNPKSVQRLETPEEWEDIVVNGLLVAERKKKKQGKQKQIKPENKQNLDKLPVSDETQKPAAKEIQNPS